MTQNNSNSVDFKIVEGQTRSKEFYQGVREALENGKIVTVTCFTIPPETWLLDVDEVAKELFPARKKDYRSSDSNLVKDYPTGKNGPIWPIYYRFANGKEIRIVDGAMEFDGLAPIEYRG